jgi:hypothetical protein
MSDATTSATSPSPYAADNGTPPDGPETSPWFAWGVAAGASLIVVLILVGAVYVNPIVSLLSGALLVAGIGATYLGVWLDDQNGPVTIVSPVVMFAAVVALVLSAMTITGVFDLARFGVPADDQSGPAIESSQAAPDASSSAAPKSVPAK